MKIVSQLLMFTFFTSQLACSGSSGGGGSAGSGDGASFFTGAKGTYEWYAKNSDASTPERYNDDNFKHGLLYTVTVDDKATENAEGSTSGVYGSVVISAEGKSRSFNFGDGVLFEKVDHEQYAVLKAETFDVTLQHVFEGDVKFINYRPHDMVNKATWIFRSEVPDAITPPLTGLAKYGAEFIVGTHTMEVYSSSNCKHYTNGDEVQITIDAEAKVTAGKFGNFSSDELSINSNSSTIMWCEGGKDTDPSCTKREKPVLRITSENAATVKGGGFQILGGSNEQTCYLRMKAL